MPPGRRGKRHEPRPRGVGYFHLGAVGPEVTPLLETPAAFPAPDVQHKTVRQTLGPYVPTAFQAGRCAVHLERNGAFTAPGYVPLGPNLRLKLKTMPEAPGNHPVDDLHRVHTGAGARLPFLPKPNLSLGPLGGCQLCNCNQVGGFAAIGLHKGRGGLAPSARQGSLALKPLTRSPRYGLAWGLRRNPASQIGVIRHET